MSMPVFKFEGLGIYLLEEKMFELFLIDNIEYLKKEDFNKKLNEKLQDIYSDEDFEDSEMVFFCTHLNDNLIKYNEKLSNIVKFDFGMYDEYEKREVFDAPGSIIYIPQLVINVLELTEEKCCNYIKEVIYLLINNIEWLSTFNEKIDKFFEKHLECILAEGIFY